MAKDDKVIKDEDVGMDVTDPRIYEVGYHILPVVAEEHLTEESAKIKDMIVSVGGIILSEEEPKIVRLAYPMDKVIANKRAWYESAFFGWIKFEAGPELLAELKKFLDGNDSLLRTIMVKTVRENTMVKKSLLFTKKPVMADREEKDKESEKIEQPVEINEEDLDKQIEELVV